MCSVIPCSKIVKKVTQRDILSADVSVLSCKGMASVLVSGESACMLRLHLN